MSNTWWKDPTELLDEQNDILDLPVDESLLINGPPGSGKTNLLLLRANHLVLSQRADLYVVVFGSVLRNFIRIGGAQYKFGHDKIVTHTLLFNKILGELGVALDTSRLSFMDGRRARSSAMLELIKDGKVGRKFDVLLVDEAQDYFPDEIRIFRALANTLVAAADVRQRVFDVEDSSAVIKDCVDNVYPLKFHYRNGLQICRLADGIMKGDPSHTPLVQHSSYDEKSYPSTVKELKNLSIEKQGKAIAEQLVAQRVAYPNEIIGVMTPRKEDLEVIGDVLSKSSLKEQFTFCKSQNFVAEKPIWLSTIASAKGLEFRAAHIAGLDSLSRQGNAQRRIAFTAITRAKTSLSLYYENKIPGYLDSALRVVAPVKAVVTRQNIFGKD